MKHITDRLSETERIELRIFMLEAYGAALQEYMRSRDITKMGNVFREKVGQL